MELRKIVDTQVRAGIKRNTFMNATNKFQPFIIIFLRKGAQPSVVVRFYIKWVMTPAYRSKTWFVCILPSEMRREFELYFSEGCTINSRAGKACELYRPTFILLATSDLNYIGSFSQMCGEEMIHKGFPESFLEAALSKAYYIWLCSKGMFFGINFLLLVCQIYAPWAIRGKEYKWVKGHGSTCHPKQEREYLYTLAIVGWKYFHPIRLKCSLYECLWYII